MLKSIFIASNKKLVGIILKKRENSFVPCDIGGVVVAFCRYQIYDKIFCPISSPSGNM